MISVVMPTYNAAHTVERALASVFSQQADEEIELLLVDDASRDDTVERVSALAYPGLRLLRQADNRGAGAARQRGIMEARGRYLAFLDADDRWESGFLAKTVEFLDAHPGVVAVSVAQRHHVIGSAKPVVTRALECVDRPMVIEDFFSFWARYNHICTGSVLIRREIAQAAGGMREDLRVLEDLEFWGLLATYGRWGFIPEILFTGEGGGALLPGTWMEKCMPRWRNTPSVGDWSRRIVPRLTEVDRAGFRGVEGMIARDTSLGMVLSSRDSQGLAEVRRYGVDLPRDRMCKMLRIAGISRVTWAVFCRFLRWRERRR